MAALAVYVVDGLDIERYADAAIAASAVEGYDAHRLQYFASDGTVLIARVLGPESGPVILEASDEHDLPELMSRLRALAEHFAVPGAAAIPDPDELYVALENELLRRRETGRRWRSRRT
ncbi:MAG: hypothetical protein AB7G36_14020 [Candidatus Nanopelagicales bacterium]